MLSKTIDQARGLRNNNPLNIRENARVDYDWQGEAVIDTDGEFEVFTDPRYGYRAAARILASYRRRGIVTLADIISTWAPDSENHTGDYIAFVSDQTGIAPGREVAPEQVPALFAAMTQYENGVNPYSLEFISEGVALA